MPALFLFLSNLPQPETFIFFPPKMPYDLKKKKKTVYNIYSFVSKFDTLPTGKLNLTLTITIFYYLFKYIRKSYGNNSNYKI